MIKYQIVINIIILAPCLLYSVALGSSNAFPNTLTFANEYYLVVQVDGAI
jgi:hypothetical protein